tara:strand:+ start:436 stop:762 length:327 start_codon:yes stop_codon:yes gene_type:complete
MTGIGGCRSSNAITADTQITIGQGKLISVHGMVTGAGDVAYIKLYDVASSGAKANSNLIGQLIVGMDPNSLINGSAEADMHGVVFRNGLYADVTVAAGTSQVFTVEFN